MHFYIVINTYRLAISFPGQKRLHPWSYVVDIIEGRLVSV